MYAFGEKSKQKLSIVSNKLQMLMDAVISDPVCPCDFTILCGHRTREEQAELYAQGRTKAGKIVTWTLDSKHCFNPSHAVDIAPYPINWGNIEQFVALGIFVKIIAKKINIKIRWGGDFKKSKDYPHFELED